MEALIASLAPGVDFTDRIGKPIRRPDEKGDDGNHENNPSAESSSPKGDLPISPTTVRHPNLCNHPVSLSNMLSPSHAKSRSDPDSIHQLSDEDSEDDVAFIESRFGQVDLVTQPVTASRAGTAGTFDSSQAERLVLGESTKATKADSASSRDVPTHKFLGKASAIHTLPLLERLSSKKYRELGFQPKGARAEYWNVPSGFLDPPSDTSVAISSWPAPDLADKLLDAYFARMHREYPMLNEAQFRHEYKNRPELREDPEWLALCFCIFMVASHYVRGDDRVLAFPNDPHSRGMHWWQAAKNLIYRNTQVSKPIVPIQCLLLSTLFQLGLPISASMAWLHLGGAIRLLVECGAHRKHAAKKLGLSRMEEETYKRTFWIAYSLDREGASTLGRPIMLQDEDIDLELPLEIDDEILFNTPESEPLPKQPSDKPALIGGFLSSLRLDEIVGRTLKTVYALQKTKVRFGINSKEWDERLVTEIDSALNGWLDTVPPHLRYDPHEPNDEWLMQSSLLYSKYYNCQILVHRPFIPAKKGASESSILNFPSLAICTNAARSISHLVQSLKDRDLHTKLGIPLAYRSVTSSCILVMVVWGAKRNGGRVSSSASSDLRRSIDVLRSMEEQWQFCGKAVDILESIMRSTSVSVPRNSSVSEQGVKRSRDGSELQDTESSTQSAFQADAEGTAKAQAPEVRQLPLSTQQLASMTAASSAEQSPSSATDSKLPPQADFSANPSFFGGEYYGPKTPQAAPRARMPSLSGASGIPASLSFGLISPSIAQWGNTANTDYMQGPHSQAAAYQSIPAVTPSIFDNFSLPSGPDDVMASNFGDMSDMSQFGFAAGGAPAYGGNGNGYGGNLDRFYQGQEGQSGQGSNEVATPQSDSSNGLTSYAFELLQKQSLWTLDPEALNILQQRGQQQ